jgi:hypothetical protein
VNDAAHANPITIGRGAGFRSHPTSVAIELFAI